MKTRVCAAMAALGLSLCGCNKDQAANEQAPPAPAFVPVAGSMDLLAEGSPKVCTADDVRQTLLAMVKPDTSAAKALANSGAYSFHSTDVDGFANAILSDLTLVTLASVNKAIKSVKCDGQLTLSAPAYGEQASSPFNIEYEVRPSIDDPSSFIISANNGPAKEAAQQLFDDIVQKIQARAEAAATSKAAAASYAAQRGFAPTPSFDCDKVTSSVLQTICGDAHLIALDNQLTQVYQAALTKADTQDSADVRQELIATERAWIGERQACGDAQCIEAAYNARIAQLSETQ